MSVQKTVEIIANGLKSWNPDLTNSDIGEPSLSLTVDAAVPDMSAQPIIRMAAA